MPVTVVVGGQFGSEGKGKVAHFLAEQMRATVAVRVGGPNSGHTVVDQTGAPRVFRQLPTASLLPRVKCVIPAGSYIRIELLLDEISTAGLSADRLLIDPNAIVITDRQVDEEEHSGLCALIGSTETGTGAAVVARSARTGGAARARDDPRLAPYIVGTNYLLRQHLGNGERLVVEGTQGFGLSVLHSPDYPFATSRDTTAAGFVSEAGLSPLDVDDVVMVIRAHPIRVAGNSGPLKDECSWEDVTRESGSRVALTELTSVSRRVRRVARFDPAIVKAAIAHNVPSRIILNHVDYIDAHCRESGELTDKAMGFLTYVESSTEAHIDFIGLGPDTLVAAPGFKRARFQVA